jgi:hypothetical protein
MHASKSAGSHEGVTVKALERSGEKRINGPPPQPSLPAVRHAIVDLIMRPLQRCPNCRRWVRAGLRPKLNLPK